MKILKVLFGTLISVFFLWFVFRNIHIREVSEAIMNSNIFYIFLFIVISVFAFAVRCYRWKIIGHEKYKNIPWRSFFKSTNMGLMLNAFVPMRGGDLFQAYNLSKRENLSKSYVLSTVFVERLVDLFPPIFTILISSIFIVLPKEITLTRLFIFILALSGVMVLLIKFGRYLKLLFSKFLAERHSQKIQDLIDNFVSAIALLKNRKIFIGVAGITVLTWSLGGAGTFVVLKSMDIDLPFFAAFLVNAITVISVAIPSAPGYVGTWEFFAMLALGIFDVEKNVSLGFALLYHFLALLPTMVFGLFYFSKEIIAKKK